MKNNCYIFKKKFQLDWRSHNRLQKSNFNCYTSSLAYHLWKFDEHIMFQIYNNIWKFPNILNQTNYSDCSHIRHIDILNWEYKIAHFLVTFIVTLYVSTIFAISERKVLDPNGPYLNTFQTILRNVCLPVILKFCLWAIVCCLSILSVVCSMSAAYTSLCRDPKYLL